MNIHNAVISAVGAYVPEYRLTNTELERMVETSDEWIMTRIGIKERRILKGVGKGTSLMAIKAVEELLAKTSTRPEEIDCVIFCTTTPDYTFPSSASLVAGAFAMRDVLTFDLSAACSGFLYGLQTAAGMVMSGLKKKVILIGADKMSSIVDYTDRNTCPLFGDGAGAVLIEPSDEPLGYRDAILRLDGSGVEHLHAFGGRSAYPPSFNMLENKSHLVFQEGRYVFKAAVSSMADTCQELMKNNDLSYDDVKWVVPHQANMRIIDAVGLRLGIDPQKVMVTIQKYGNTSAATLPLCLHDYEQQLHKGDNIIFTAFGAGYTWGALYLKWAYDTNQ